MSTIHHEEPSLFRMELLGHLAAAARLALAESPSADGVSLSVETGAGGIEFECVLLVAGNPVSGWVQS